MSLHSVVRASILGLAIGGLWTVPSAIAAEPSTATTPPAATTPASNSDPVVARVDGTDIRRSDVLSTLTTLPAQVRQMPPETIFPAILEQMINGKLVATAATHQKLKDDPEFKDKMVRAEERVMQEIFLTRAVKARITDDVLKTRYKKYVDENPAQDEVRASHILVATEAEAKALLDQLKGGADFAKLAKDKSTDSAAAAQGGDLGFFTREAMVAPFSEAAFNGTVGKVITSPVHTQFGWHVIRVDERRKATVSSLDDVRGELENEMSQEIVGGVVKDLREKAKIELFRMDGTPMPPAPQPK
ncbi:MAG: peptidylprolyl isomerase [Rhodospirillaceae bacterium]